VSHVCLVLRLRSGLSPADEAAKISVGKRVRVSLELVEE